MAHLSELASLCSVTQALSLNFRGTYLSFLTNSLVFDILSGEWFQVVKMLWRYIKENKLQDPNDGRRIICDESLRSLFPFESINMFQMNKLLTKHIWPLEDTAGI